MIEESSISLQEAQYGCCKPAAHQAAVAHHLIEELSFKTCLKYPFFVRVKINAHSGTSVLEDSAIVRINEVGKKCINF